MERTFRHWAWLAGAVCWLAAGQVWAAEAEEQYTVAFEHYAAQRWELAAEQFASLLAEHENHERAVEAMYCLGESLVQLGRLDEARTRFGELLEREPSGRFARQALFRRGEAAYLSGKLGDAKTDLALFHTKYASDTIGAFALPYLGEIALREEDFPAAQKHFSAALQQFPAGPMKHDCRLGLGRALDQQGRTSEAERLFRELVADSQCALADRAHFYLGLLHYRAGKHEKALEIWKTFEQQFPESSMRPRVELGRGWALYNLERYGEAQERLMSLVQDEAVGIEAQYWLGLTQRAQKQWKQAAETLVTAAGADPAHRLLAAMRFHAGDSLMHVGDREGAVRQFDVVLKQFSDSKWAAESLFGKLQAAIESENYGDADRWAVQFQEQFAASPLKTESHLFRATALKALEKYAEAAVSLEAYLAAAPETAQTPAARAELVSCCIRLGKLGDAKKGYETLLANSPKHDVVLPITSQLAEAAFAAGDRAWACELFQQMAAEGNPPEHIAKGLAGLAWSKLNAEDLPGAAALFERLLKEFPKDPLASEAALTRGQIFEQQENVDAALAMYLLVIQEYPQSAERSEALVRAARIHDKLQQDQQASTLYERLVSEFPKFPQMDAVLYGWAWVLLELERADEADLQFARLHGEFPKSKYWADATYRLAKRASESSDYDRAVGLLHELVEANPDKDILAHALYLEGRIASRRELWEEVERPMARLVNEVSESTLRRPAEYSIAEAAFRQEKFDAAYELLKKLDAEIEAAREPWMAIIPLRLAQVRCQRGEWKEALENAKQVAASFPDFPRRYEADYVVGRCHAALGEFDAARQAYLAVIRSPEGSKTETAAMAQWMIGETYFHQKDYPAARREFLRTEILYDYPQWQAGALLEAGKCHELLAQWQEAREVYDRLLKKYPETSFTDEATRRQRVAEQRAGQ